MKRLLLSIILIGMLLFTVTGCASTTSLPKSSSSGNQVQSITVDQLKKQVNAGIDKDTIIVDLRESMLYKNGHIPGAILIPFADFEKEYTQLDKNKKIILVCHMGPMGDAAGQFLISKGYGQVYNLDGGMRAWDNM